MKKKKIEDVCELCKIYDVIFLQDLVISFELSMLSNIEDSNSQLEIVHSPLNSYLCTLDIGL